MVSMISPTAEDKILEPCGGDGVFIDTMLELKHDLHIDTCDLNVEAVDTLKRKYSDKPNIKVWHTDTLMDETFDSYVNSKGYYDKIIGNPPYGGWQEYEHRAKLKKKYNGFYVKETYSLFLLRCISMLKDGGILSFIIPDTFLYLHNHTALRAYLLNNTKIKEVIIFPSKFFPGVSFGYSNLSIITVEKTDSITNALNNVVKIIKDLKTDKDLQRVGLRENIEDLTQIELKQADIFDNEYHAFILNDGILNEILTKTNFKLGDIADCVTGIYTGNNQEYLGITAPDVKNGKGYPVIDSENIDFDCTDLTGVKSDKKYIPIVKSSSKTKYTRKSVDWVIDWSEDAITHYNTDKKARFQNSSFYFKTGLALPMVKSSRINATLMQGMVFDQSIVGVFPKEGKYLYFLLGFMNSDIANNLIHLINPTANNSANYLKKLPVILPTETDLNYINGLIKAIIANGTYKEEHKQINQFFNKLFGVNEIE